MILTSLAALALTSASASADISPTPIPAQSWSAYAADEAYSQDTHTNFRRVIAAQALAQSQGKNLVIILGAQWCDDSRAIAGFFEDEAFAAQMADSYEVVFVNAGGFEHGLDIVQHFGQPAYYATPTVLVINPETNAVVNLESQAYWRSASTRDLTEAVAYFEDYAPNTADTDLSPGLAAAFAQIQAFEAREATRMLAGFEHIQTLVALDEEDQPEGFMDDWNQFKQARYDMSQTLSELYAEARRQDEAGIALITLDFPTFDDWQWTVS